MYGNMSETGLAIWPGVFEVSLVDSAKPMHMSNGIAMWGFGGTVTIVSNLPRDLTCPVHIGGEFGAVSRPNASVWQSRGFKPHD